MELWIGLIYMALLDPLGGLFLICGKLLTGLFLNHGSRWGGWNRIEFFIDNSKILGPSLLWE